MPPFRIPFTTKRPLAASGLEPPNDENARPSSNGVDTEGPYKDKPSLALGIKGSKEEPNEFKMSSVNDSGVYLPPSPPEKKSFWHRSPHSTHSSNNRSTISENEPFSISRESFESYRRSFDISGRSPIIGADSFPSRTSLDSRSLRLPRSAVNGNTFDRPRPTQEEDFEDVGLDDPKPKKKSFLSRFGESAPETPQSPSEGKQGSSHQHHFHIPGRKRGQSGTGSELNNMERPGSKGKVDVPVR